MWIKGGGPDKFIHVSWKNSKISEIAIDEDG